MTPHTMRAKQKMQATGAAYCEVTCRPNVSNSPGTRPNPSRVAASAKDRAADRVVEHKPVPFARRTDEEHMTATRP